MKKTIILIMALLTLGACTDLEVAPNSKLTEENAYQQPGEFLNGLAGVYGSTGKWFTVVYKFCSSSDEMIFPARGADWKGDLQSIQDHSWTATNGEIADGYNDFSNMIAVSNDLINTIDKRGFANDSTVKVIRGEARLIRAFAYFLMVDHFGRVPLVTDGKYDPKNPPKQNSREELYHFVEQELIDLSKNVLPATSDYGRVNKYAAKTLLAKLYLNAQVYVGTPRWGAVDTLTQEVMTKAPYKLEDNFKAIFAWDNYKSTENIFVVVCDSKNTAAENISYLFSINDLTAKYGSYADGWCGASTLPTFYRSFEENDLRRQMFLAGPQVDDKGKPIMAKDDQDSTRQLTYTIDFISADPVYNADHWDGPRGVKYLMDGIGGPMKRSGLNNDIPILRLADVMLMRAEALLRQNPASGEALELVNTVRTRKGNNGVAPFTHLDLEMLLAERGREFAWEGWRRNDMIRFDKWGNTWDYKPKSDPKYKLFPIPQAQMDSNPYLVQNPGY